uniref:Uncharacterized protein n=1 Tax=Anopheles minimus TaxID=112268 RepID=A0A182WPT8_9DIPT
MENTTGYSSSSSAIVYRPGSLQKERSRISLVGALRRCSGTPGIGPFHSSIDARQRLYASYTSRLLGARAR